MVVEDEADFADYLRRGLTYEGYRISLASSGEAGLVLVRQLRPDLVILDVMLPGIDGLALCRRLREAAYAGPVLMLTARGAVNDRIVGLDAGADDYLAKPFAFDELLARLRSLLRRFGAPGQTRSVADLEIDLGLRQVRRGTTTIALTRTEFDLLVLLSDPPGQVVTRDLLLDLLWGETPGQETNILDVYVSRLRRKLGHPGLIQTLYGVGYLLREDQV